MTSVKITCIENGEKIEFEEKLDWSNCIHLGYGVFPVKEAAYHIKMMYKNVTSVKIEAVVMSHEVKK